MTLGRFSGKELTFFCQYLCQKYGLNFDLSKYGFLENRIIPLMEKFSCSSLSDLIKETKVNLAAETQLLNLLTTNETWFFRHPNHFKILKHVLIPALIKEKEKKSDNRLRIWSAGCSTGAELFSILITLFETLENPIDWNIRITGSDLSSDAVKRGKRGVFTAAELRDTAPKLVKKYFSPITHDEYKITPELTRLATFETMNLLDTWPPRTFDIIFCRNTMIYFDKANKAKTTERFFKALNLGGFYFTSANEILHWGEEDRFKKVFIMGDYIYQKQPQVNEYLLMHFKTPNDLLRAVNLFTKNGVDYQLMMVPRPERLAPQRAIYFPIKNLKRVEELFSLSEIKVTHKEIISK